MRINSIGVCYQVNAPQKKYTNNSQKIQNPNFQKNYRCSKVLGLTMTGLGIGGAAGLAELCDATISTAALLAIGLGGLMGLTGFSAGKDLDDTIAEGKEKSLKFKKEHQISDKK